MRGGGFGPLSFYPSFSILLYILNPGQPIIGTSKAWLGRFGEVGHPYNHPSTKQCSYEIDTDQFATKTYVNDLVKNRFIDELPGNLKLPTADKFTKSIISTAYGNTGTRGTATFYPVNVHLTIIKMELTASLSKSADTAIDIGTNANNVLPIYAEDVKFRIGNSNGELLSFDTYAYTSSTFSPSITYYRLHTTIGGNITGIYYVYLPFFVYAPS